MEEIKWRKIIKDNGLIHASSRKLPLITVSCIFIGYTSVLKERVGYSYKNICAISKRDEAEFLINEDEVGRSFSKTVKKKKLGLLIKKMQKTFDRNKKLVEEAKKEKDCFKTLKDLLSIYPEVISQMGFYNSIMRHVKDNQERAGKLDNPASFIAKDKDVVADLIYTEIEPLIEKCTNKIGKTYKIDGDLLRYTTLKEFKEYIKKKRISTRKIAELSKRRKNYLFLVSGGKEYITSDKKIIDSVCKEFIDIKRDVNILKGATAYPGKVVGKVYKVFHGVKVSKPGYVLVTTITKPEDTPLLRKFAAIITNEGGILSHIAIVAREFKIPSVMSTKIATKVLKDGDLVEVDANKGVIRIIRK